MRTAAFGVSAAALAIAVFAAGPASASEFQVGQVDITTQVTIPPASASAWRTGTNG